MCYYIDLPECTIIASFCCFCPSIVCSRVYKYFNRSNTSTAHYEKKQKWRPRIKTNDDFLFTCVLKLKYDFFLNTFLWCFR